MQRNSFTSNVSSRDYDNRTLCELHKDIGVCYYYLKKHDEALKHFILANQALLDNSCLPDDNRTAGELYNDIGVAYFRFREYEKSIEFFSLAIKENVDDARAYNNKAWAHWHANTFYELALKDCNRAIELGLKEVSVYEARSFFYELLNNYAAAISDCSKAIELAENNPIFSDVSISIFYYNRGLSYYKNKQFNKAFDDFYKAVRKDPAYSGSYYELGLTCARLNNNGKAMLYFIKAVIIELKADDDKRTGILNMYLRKLSGFKLPDIINAVYTLPKEDGMFLFQQCKNKSSPLANFCEADILQYIEDNVDEKKFMNKPSTRAASGLFVRQDEKNKTSSDVVRSGSRPGF